MKLFFALLLALPTAVVAGTTVRGYVKSDGTYVAPHVRSSPNSNKYDNYSSQGNVNPYTGKAGSQRNEFSDPPAYNNPRPAPAPYGYQPQPTQPYYGR